MMAVAAAQKNREMFAIKKSYSIEVSSLVFRVWDCVREWKPIVMILIVEAKLAEEF